MILAELNMYAGRRTFERFVILAGRFLAGPHAIRGISNKTPMFIADLRKLFRKKREVRYGGKSHIFEPIGIQAQVARACPFYPFPDFFFYRFCRVYAPAHVY
jgi:hypothetical protein